MKFGKIVLDMDALFAAYSPLIGTAEGAASSLLNKDDHLTDPSRVFCENFAAKLSAVVDMVEPENRETMMNCISSVFTTALCRINNFDTTTLLTKTTELPAPLDRVPSGVHAVILSNDSVVDALGSHALVKMGFGQIAIRTTQAKGTKLFMGPGICESKDSPVAGIAEQSVTFCAFCGHNADIEMENDDEEPDAD